MVQICGALVTGLIVLTAPITFVLFLLPLYSYRFFLLLWVKAFKSQDQMVPLDPISSILGADEIYTHPGINICVSFMLEESYLSKQQVIEIFRTKLLYAKIDTKLRFPQLQQEIIQWMGISWWKTVRKCNIKNHIYFIEDQSSNPVSMDEYFNKPFREGLSPWDLLIMCNKSSNLGPVKYEIIYRFHHALHDGYGVTEALSHLFGTTYDYYMPSKVKKGLQLFVPIRSIYEFISSELRTVEKTSLDLKMTSSSLRSFEVTTCSTAEIPFTRILEIKQKFHVRTTSILLAAFAGGIRSWLLRNGHNLPNYIKTSVPVAINGNRKPGITNQFSQIVLNLAVNEPNSITRLAEIDREFHKMKNSTYALTCYYLTITLGKLINPILRYILNNRPWPPFAVSCVVGPKDKLKFDGIGVESINASMACKKYGVLLTIFSYNQNYQLNITANRNVIPTTSLLEELRDDISNEFQNLKNSNRKDFRVTV